MNQDQYLPKMPSEKTARMFFILSVITGALSGILGNVILLDMVAATMTSVALLSIRRPTIGRMTAYALGCAVLSALIAVGTHLLLYRQFFPAALTAMGYALCALIIAICVFRLKSRSLTVLLSALVFLLTAAVSFLGLIYDYYGEISFSVLAKMEEQIRTTLIEYVQNYVNLSSAGQSEPILSSADIQASVQELIQSYKLMLPAICFDLTLLASYIVTGIFRRILLGYYFGRRNLSGWLVTISRSTGIVYLCALGLYMILSVLSLFSSGNWTLILTAAVVNILLLTMPGCLCIGLRNIISQLKLRPGQSLINLLLLVVIGCCNPVFLLFYLGFIGAFYTVFLPKIQKMRGSGPF
ncbi:MAG: hypothetical protein ACI3YK_06045 [Eubacteriales bacterium]